MVYGHCELEECVSMRLVSRFGYWMFHRSQETLKQKLQDRNPTIKPGESGSELVTWLDCVLVFAARLQSEKWTRIESVDELPSSCSPTPQTPISVKVSEHVLPSDYKGLVNCFGDGAHFEMNLRGEYALNVCTFEAKLAEMEELVLEEDNDKFTVLYKGVEATFPADMINYDGLWSNSTVIAAVGQRCYVLPLEYPDFRQGHGFYVDSGDFSRGLECGFGTWSDSDAGRTFKVADLAQKKFIELFTSTEVQTHVAQFNGLDWFSRGPQLVPVFFDLADNQCYSRADRVFQAADFFTSYQGSKCFGAERFVLADKLVLDLATVTITRVEGAGDFYLPGFSNGVFEVWGLSDKCMGKLDERLQRLLDAGQWDDFDLAT